MSRILQYLNPFDEESQARRADRQGRAESYGSQFAKTPAEQLELARQSGGDVSTSAAEGFLREGSQGSQMDLGSMMEGFDPQNAESVRQMQRALNQAGFTDEGGNPLSEDGKLGAKTTGALRRMQGGHRSDNANMNELKGGEGSFMDNFTNVNDKGKDLLYSREGRDSRTAMTGSQKVVDNIPMLGGMASDAIAPENYVDLNTKVRQNTVGDIRSGAKSIDDAIESAAPWLGGSSLYRGAKSGIKKFFDRAGDSEY